MSLIAIFTLDLEGNIMHSEMAAAVPLIRRAICCAFFVLLVASITHANADDFHNALSLQGFTGLLNIPNAKVTAEGRFYGLYSNQKESKWRKQVWRQESYMFSLGLFSF